MSATTGFCYCCRKMGLHRKSLMLLFSDCCVHRAFLFFHQLILMSTCDREDLSRSTATSTGRFFYNKYYMCPVRWAATPVFNMSKLTKAKRGGPDFQPQSQGLNQNPSLLPKTFHAGPCSFSLSQEWISGLKYQGDCLKTLEMCQGQSTWLEK